MDGGDPRCSAVVRHALFHEERAVRPPLCNCSRKLSGSSLRSLDYTVRVRESHRGVKAFAALVYIPTTGEVPHSERMALDRSCECLPKSQIFDVVSFPGVEKSSPIKLWNPSVRTYAHVCTDTSCTVDLKIVSPY